MDCNTCFIDRNDGRDEVKNTMNAEKTGRIIVLLYLMGVGFSLASGNLTLQPIMILAGLAGYALFKREVSNIFLSSSPRSRNNYVVCYFTKNANKKPLKYFVVPDETGYGKIENGNYDLSKANALPDELSFKGRLHFLIEEGNPIPVKAEIKELDKTNVLFIQDGKIFFEASRGYQLSDPDQDKIKTWAFSVQRALVTTWFKVLYAEARQWAFIIALLVAVIGIAISIYEYNYIQSVQPLVSAIYQHTVIENASMIIRPSGS